MSAAADNTWDLVPPRRPSLADCGSATKTDDALYPPDPVTMPTAAEWNLFAKLIAQAGGLMANVRVQVSTAGAGGVAAIWSMATNATVNTPSNYTVVKNGVGDWSITWAANTFPTPMHNPRAFMVTAGKWCLPDAQPITNGIRVKTYNDAGAATDGDFLFELF